MIELYPILPAVQPNIHDAISSHGFLDPNDPDAISFWVISISMVAASAFFLMESMYTGAYLMISL